MGVYYPGDHLYYNDFDLTGVPGFAVTSFMPYDLPVRTMESYALARKSGEVLVSSFFDKRPITVRGTFTGLSKGAFETSRDTLLNALSAPGGRLEGMVAGALRRFMVTLESAKIPKNFGGYAEVEIVFEAYDPFGYNPIATSVAIGTFTANNTTSSNITFGGTYNAVPVITATINTLTASGSQSVTVTNPASTIAVTITRTWTAGDVISIDTNKRTVTINGVNVPWTGAMPEWNTGVGNLKWSDTFSARNVTWSLLYNARYL